MSLPGALLPNLNRQFFDDDGAPLAGGSIVPFVAGSDPGTPKLLYADADLTTPLATTVVLDTAGRVTAFMASGGYDFEVYDSDDVLQYTVLGVEDVGQTWLSTLAQQLSAGSKSVSSGYTILTTDSCVSVDSSSGAATINLLPAADCVKVLTIVNLHANTVAVTPDGAETISGIASAFTMAASSSPIFSTIVLLSDGISNYIMQSYTRP